MALTILKKKMNRNDTMLVPNRVEQVDRLQVTLRLRTGARAHAGRRGHSCGGGGSPGHSRLDTGQAGVRREGGTWTEGCPSPRSPSTAATSA